MTHRVTLTITSLLSILFMAFHLADDIVRGIWLYGTLALAERRPRYVLLLLGSMLGSGVPSST